MPTTIRNAARRKRWVATNKVYLVDATSGADTNGGTTESSPLQTITAVNALPLKPGDRVLFKRGETFAGKLAPTRAGKPSNQKAITYGAYGSGDKPVINGSGETSSLIINGANYNNLRYESIDFSGGATDGTVYIADGHDLYFYDCIIRDSGADKSGFVAAASAAPLYRMMQSR